MVAAESGDVGSGKRLLKPVVLLERAAAMVITPRGGAGGAVLEVACLRCALLLLRPGDSVLRELLQGRRCVAARWMDHGCRGCRRC